MKYLSLTILIWFFLVTNLVAQTNDNKYMYSNFNSSKLLSDNASENTILSASASSTACSITIDNVTNVGCHGDSTGAINTTVLVDTSSCTSNVVALNEFLYNPSRLHRDGLNPYAGEFIELIGPAGADISCYVLTDGDWTITLPVGSIIPPDGFFTIGNDSIWGIGTFDLDAENCNCFTDGIIDGLLVLTTGGEYVALYDAAGTFLEGVIYGTPSSTNIPPTTPTAIATIGAIGCLDSVIIPTASAFETVLGGVADDVSLVRSPDGSGAWVPQVDGSLNACNNLNQGANTNYLWSNGDTTQNISGLPAGTYTVTFTSSSGCTDTASYTITEPAAIVLDVLNSTDPSCHGESTGIIEVTNTGGIMPYTYLWSNTATTQNLDNVRAGIYNLTLTDGNGCTVPLSVVLTEPSAVSVTYSTTNVSCGGTNDGTASVTPVGGTAGYTYLWDVTANNQTTATATNLSSNTYSVTVTDLEGCITEANGVFVNAGVPVDSNDVPLVVLTGMLDCDLNPIGALEINTSNDYIYLWSNGETSGNVSGLSTGTYFVTVSNGLGCSYVQTATINRPFVPTINPFIVNVGLTATTVTSGTVVAINGGNDQSLQGVTYNWTNPSSDVRIETPTAHTTTAISTTRGSYLLTLTATATDSSVCQDTASVVLNVASAYTGMPNAFTPNDDGINDLYRPIGLSAEDVVTFRVYNRWGQIVYKGDDLENMGWDGRLHGVEQATEVYLFILEYKLGANEETNVEKGEFSLVR